MAHEYGKETLSKEFKSDRDKGLPDSELVEAVVALANTDGGCVYLGVEDDGTATGVQRKHQDPVGLSAMIANRTVPPISVRAQLVGDGVTVIQVDVPKSHSVVSTKSGRILRRMMKVDGTPESVPMYPYEIATRLSDLGKLDYSAQPVPGATREDFDPLERDRLRKIRGTDQLSERDVRDLLDAVHAGEEVPGSACPQPERHAHPSAEVESVVDLMVALVRIVSEKSGIATQLIATRDDLVEFAQDRSKSRLATGWRHELAGKQLESLLEGSVGLTVRDGRIEVI